MQGCHGGQRYIIFAELPNLSLCFFGKVPFLDKIVAMILPKKQISRGNRRWISNKNTFSQQSKPLQ